MEYKGTQYGGYYMEYPTLNEAKKFSRELEYDERICVQMQGFHFGTSQVNCYSFGEFVAAVGKREFKNPAGGVRSLEKSEIVPWIANVIGDKELANAILCIFHDSEGMQEITDKIGTVIYVRKAQYDEVIAFPEECEEV